MNKVSAVASPPPYVRGRFWTFAGAGVLSVLASHWRLSSTFIVPVAFAAIAIAVWHGAFDGVLAEEVLLPRHGASWRLIFYASYVGLGAAVVLLWWLAPVAALTLFLLYSALHFGTESELHLSPERVLTGMAAGLVPIAAACAWWPLSVSAIFAEMLRGNHAQAAAVTLFAGRTLWVAVALAVFGGFRSGSQVLISLGLLATELMLFRWCPPLTAFAVYFCLWHTPEHMVSTSLDRARHFQAWKLRKHLWRGLLPWLVSIGALAVAGWYGQHTAQAYVGVLFIGLSALTVPHMILSEVCRRGASSASDQKSGIFEPHTAVNQG
jgi:Brp/Blh family beta-carotene 15,15'-monooxygenase